MYSVGVHQLADLGGRSVIRLHLNAFTVLFGLHRSVRQTGSDCAGASETVLLSVIEAWWPWRQLAGCSIVVAKETLSRVYLRRCGH
jgi:hypothetical protein